VSAIRADICIVYGNFDFNARGLSVRSALRNQISNNDGRRIKKKHSNKIKLRFGKHIRILVDTR